MSWEISEAPCAKDTRVENDENTTEMRYLLASREAQAWKKKYQDCAKEKLSQLGDIESSLMVLEARLLAERNDLERLFKKQSRTIKEQKRKIAKLTTVNQKLLNGLMALSDQAGISHAPPPYSSHHMPPEYKSSIGETSKPLIANVNHSAVKPANPNRRHRSSAAQDSGLSKPVAHKTQRSRSLPMNRHTMRLSKGTEC